MFRLKNIIYTLYNIGINFKNLKISELYRVYIAPKLRNFRSKLRTKFEPFTLEKITLNVISRTADRLLFTLYLAIYFKNEYFLRKIAFSDYKNILFII